LRCKPHNALEERLTSALSLSDRFDQGVFDAIYSRSLVYNACWEDPAVDREALSLRPQDRVLVITSAGCNALDYALAGPARIHAVDANPRQTALLELKLAGIRRLDFPDFFLLFGNGHHPGFPDLYRERLRGELSDFARAWWDRNGSWFTGRDAQRGFYFHGLSGMVARGFHGYLRTRPALREALEAFASSRTLDEQREAYARGVAGRLWTRPVVWALSRQITMSMIGVPHPQRKEVERQHAGGVAGFVRESIEYIAHQIPVWTNYFWTLYLRGRYSFSNCPEYLKRRNFLALKAGLADRITPHTCTVTEFLRSTEERISRFVLLDHMDWMSSYRPQALAEEWNAILARATGDARLIFRSAHAKPSYLDQIRVGAGGAECRLADVLRFDPHLAARLTRRDRVHTYAGFHIAEVAT
jgi:S-adenosylmethionine-diacylglycerol 3-amino-3-carboxypropyl transferase